MFREYALGKGLLPDLSKRVSLALINDDDGFTKDKELFRQAMELTAQKAMIPILEPMFGIIDADNDVSLLNEGSPFPVDMQRSMCSTALSTTYIYKQGLDVVENVTANLRHWYSDIQ